ncbi:hypothetical protein ACJX0J_014238, partial [Zea mays]
HRDLACGPRTFCFQDSPCMYHNRADSPCMYYNYECDFFFIASSRFFFRTTMDKDK